MTKREIISRLLAAHNGQGNGYDEEGLRRLRLDLAADVQAEEAPRHPEDDGREPGPTSVSVTVPEGSRVVVEIVNGKKT